MVTIWMMSAKLATLGLFEGWTWPSFNNLRQALGITSRFYTSVTKGLRLKVRKFLGLILAFV